MLTNTMSLEDHVKKINLAKSKVKNSIFEMAEAITNAVNQLDNQQKDLAQKLGMSRGTLSKWIAIGSNQSLMNMKNSVPESFDTLYQLSSLDKQYHKFYGKTEGHKNFLKLFKDNLVTPFSQRKDISKILKLHKEKINKPKKNFKYLNNENELSNTNHKGKSEIKLKVLIKSKLFFNTIVVVPLQEQLNHWRKSDLFQEINVEYPLGDLQNKDQSIFQVCLIKVRGEDLDLGIKALNSWGYNYNKVLTPKQPKSSFIDMSSDFFVLIGSNSKIKKENFIMRSDETIDLIGYAQKIGEQPYLFVGEKINVKDWIYCVG